MNSSDKKELKEFMMEHLYEWDIPSGQGSYTDSDKLAELVYEWAYERGLEDGIRSVHEE